MREQFEKAYGELYDAIKGNEMFCEKFLNVNTPQITSFTAYQGNKYRLKGKNGIKLMIVGQAVNGWDEKRFYHGDELIREDFIRSSLLNLESDSSTYSRNDRFEWIGESDGYTTPLNEFRKGIDDKNNDFNKDTGKGKYRLGRSIWQPLRLIACQLLDIKAENAWKERWFENTAISNLFKIAERVGGNPSPKLKECQLASCKDLLLLEIEYFNPTHILFVTNWTGWFEYFADCFPEVHKTEPKERNVVLGKGIYKFEKVSAKVVVTVRPDRGAEGRFKPTHEEYKNAVLDAFNDH